MTGIRNGGGKCFIIFHLNLSFNRLCSWTMKVASDSQLPPYPLDVRHRLEAYEIGHMFFLQHYGINLALSSAEQAFFLNNSLGVLHNDYSSSPLDRAKRRCSLALYFEKLLRCLDANPQKCADSSMTSVYRQVPEFLRVQFIHPWVLGNHQHFSLPIIWWLQQLLLQVSKSEL